MSLLALMLAGAVTLPPELRAYVARRDLCEHYAGEDGYDAARRRELDQLIARSRCLTLEADRKRLRVRFIRPAERRALRPLWY